MYKGERDVLEETREMDACDMEEFGTLLEMVARKRSLSQKTRDIVATGGETGRK